MTSFRITDEIGNAQAYYDRLSSVMKGLSTRIIDDIAYELFAAYQRNSTIFLFGNGGSAALASHFACDLGKGTSDRQNNRKGIRVIALTDNIPTMTAWANDASYSDIFSEQLRNLVQADDVVVAISCSGNSPNVLKALTVARDSGATTIGLGGFQGGKMRELCNIAVVVPSENMQIIEDLHLTIAHCVFTLVKSKIEAEAAPRVSAAVAG